MIESGRETLNRRLVVAGPLVAAAGLSMPRQMRGRIVTQRGMAGGGMLKIEAGEAIFSLFASRLILPEDNKEIIAGSIHWIELPSGLTLASAAVTAYEVVPSDVGEARRIEGTMRVNGEGDYPFVLDVVDSGLPGSGEDTVSLSVGGSGETAGAATPSAGFLFAYQAEGMIAAGDIQEVDIDFNIESGVAIVATPAGAR